MTEATNNAKYNPLVSSFGIAGRNLALSENFKAISTKIIPSTRHMFAMFHARKGDEAGKEETPHT